MSTQKFDKNEELSETMKKKYEQSNEIAPIENRAVEIRGRNFSFEIAQDELFFVNFKNCIGY